MSSWHGSQLKYALGLGGLFSFYGVVSVITLMLPGTFVGYKYKILIIAIVLLTLPFALLIGFVASRRAAKKKKKAEEAAAAESASQTDSQPAPAQKTAAPAGTYDDITKGTEEAVQFLKSSNLGEAGQDAIYSLPWFLVAGPPKSGKSSLLLSSNLNFHTLPGQRQSEQKMVRPTAGVEWRVTSDAVFIDTAGRYQTEGFDGDEWSALLENIRKYRPNRPLDGMILVLDAQAIQHSDEREAEETAKVMRTRLDDAMQRLKVKFPVYVVFTNSDSMEGFRDSFSASKNEDKTLVWGSTIPLEKSENAQAMFDGEYEILQNAVMKRRITRLSAPFPAVRQLRIFNFPLHFGAARRRFGAFMNALFRPNPFSENPFLRGFYFAAVPSSNGASGAVRTAGQGYFTERFFRDVLLRDKDLVKTFQSQKARPPIFGWSLTILGMAFVVLLLVLSAVSLFSNKQMLSDAEVRGERVLTIVKADAGKNPFAKSEDEVRRELSAVEDLRQLLARLDDYDRNGPPIYMRFGLYSGEKVFKKSLLPMYFSVIEQRFKAPAVRKLEADLRKFADSSAVFNPNQISQEQEQVLDKHYEMLKAYLMLSGDFRAKAQGADVVLALKDYWVSESKVPSDMKLTALQQLDFWAKQIDRDDSEVRFPRISTNAKLVEDARRKLQALPPVFRYYSRKVTEISKEIDDRVGQTNVSAILTRNGTDTSTMDGTYSVPSAFTRSGYELMKTAISEAEQKLSEDDWVMGESAKKDVAQATDAARLEDRYFRDYADHWRNFIKGVDVKAYKNKTDAAAALQSFSSANSPMKILLREVAKNTNLSAPLENPGWIDWLMSFFESKKTGDTGGTQPEKEFRPLFAFVGSSDKPDAAPIEKYQSEIGKAFNDFSTVSEDRMKKIAEQMANEEDPIRIVAREKAVGNLLAGFSETPSGQETAALLQKPIGNLKSLLGAGAKQQLAKIWAEQILPEAADVQKGYPFEDGQAEVDLTKLTAFLNPTDGKFSKFYDDKLSRYFEESNGRLRVKETSELQFSDDFVEYINGAIELRKALFGTNPTPKFEYEFALRPVRDGLIEVTIDGQKITSEGTGSMKGTFPAGSSAETGVLINLVSVAGGQTPSGSPGGFGDASASSQTYQGNWGLFRFVDSSNPTKQPGGEYLLTFSVGGKSASATIKPSGGDLFDRAIFRKAKAPQNFLK